MTRQELECAVCAAICQSRGIKAREQFEFVPIGARDMVLPVCSGDMLFNVFDEYMGFLN